MEMTYFRLCHHCLHLNESTSEVIRCQECQRYLTLDPLLQYLDESTEESSTMEIEASEEFVAPRPSGARSDEIGDPAVRIQGLSVRW